MKTISNCEVCDTHLAHTALDLGMHPLCDDLKPIGFTGQQKEYPIEILHCPKCLTAHQKYQVPKTELFPVTYHYRSRFTADVLKGMQDFVKSCTTTLGPLQNKTVLDIGCNDGTLLGFFASAGASKTIGVDPTDAIKDASDEHQTYQGYFDIALAESILDEHGTVDLITFTNVFAHIENLKGLLNAVKILCHDETVIAIENHYLGEVLARNQFDTFYHEHPRTYCLTSFAYIAKSLGMEVMAFSFPKRYGGNIRVMLNKYASSNPDALTAHMEKEKAFSTTFKNMAQNIARWVKTKTQEIETLNTTYGLLRAKAFPGRAAILIKLLNLNVNHISTVYEKPGSMKVGHYLPGTQIPIESDESFDVSDKTPIINLAWHISDEIHRYMRTNHFEGEIIDILSEVDFQ